MKKKISISFIFAIIASFILSSCVYENDYEEGPFFKLQTKNMRLINEWKIEKHVENDEEKPYDPKWDSESIEFKRNGEFIYTTSSGSEVGTWEWEASTDKRVVFFQVPSLNISGSMFILRLKANQLWVGDVSNMYQYVSK